MGMKNSFLSNTTLVLFFLVSFPGLSNAQDWGGLNHFKEANKEMNENTNNNDRIVFFGNSITIGWLHSMPAFFEGKPYVNRGISGQTTPQMLVRFRQDVIALKPKVVVILAGTNDIAGNTGTMTLEQILDNIISMTQLAQANNIQVVLSSVLPAAEYHWKPGMLPAVKIPELNAMLESYASNNNVVYLNYFSALVNKENGMNKDLAEDGVHPTRKGYEIMAPLAEKAIEKALSLSN